MYAWRRTFWLPRGRGIERWWREKIKDKTQRKGHLGNLAVTLLTQPTQLPLQFQWWTPQYLPISPFDEALFVPAAGNTVSRHQLSAPSGTFSASESCLDQGHIFLGIIQRPTTDGHLMCRVKAWPSVPNTWLCWSAILASVLPWVIWGNLWASVTIPLLFLFS